MQSIKNVLLLLLTMMLVAVWVYHLYSKSDGMTADNTSSKVLIVDSLQQRLKQVEEACKFKTDSLIRIKDSLSIKYLLVLRQKDTLQQRLNWYQYQQVYRR